MGSARVTLVVLPRDRFSVTERSLESVLERTPAPFELIYIDGRSPRRTRSYLLSRSREFGFQLVRFEEYLSPNRARNIGAAMSSTEYTVFVDNDAIVADGWLPPLVDRADATGAWVVGPLYLVGELDQEMIHAAGGELILEGPASARSLTSVHVLQGTPMSELTEPLEARRCGFAEFHCMLVRTEAIRQIGPFDEALLSAREHEDFCLRVQAHGGEVWFEPTSVVTYLPPPRRPDMTAGPPLRFSDVPYFARRWSRSWNEHSTEHFMSKYGLEPGYRMRVRSPNEQRHAMLMPIRNATGRFLGPKLEERLWQLLVAVERRVNARLFSTTGPTSERMPQRDPTSTLPSCAPIVGSSYTP